MTVTFINRKYGKIRINFFENTSYTWDMKPIYILFVSLIFKASLSYAQPSEGTFCIKLSGDTIKGLNKVFLESEKHPQYIEFTTAGDKKIKISADSIKSLRINKFDYSSKKFVPVEYYVIAILTKNKSTCSHFVTNVYTQNNFSICYTPYCSQCGRLKYYVTENGKYVTMLTKTNFNQLVKDHFSEFANLVQLANTKKYTASRLSKILRHCQMKFRRHNIAKLIEIESCLVGKYSLNFSLFIATPQAPLY